jgi:hypothetical protein
MKKTRPEPEYLQAFNLNHLSDVERESLIEFIAIKYNEEPFQYDGNDYIMYNSFCHWHKNYNPKYA